MKKQVHLLVIFTLLSLYGFAQNTLPLKSWPGKASAPLVFYISGDGGFNKFSTDLCTEINAAGYPVTALNARSYFWNEKPPEQATADISHYLEKELALKNYQNIVFVGYSFGADVMPFIVNKLPAVLKEKLKSVVLISFSAFTDFEVHLFDFFGDNSKNSKEVLSAINLMNVPKGAIIFGADESGFDPNRVKLKNWAIITLPGGHHYDDNTSEVASVVMKHF